MGMHDALGLRAIKEDLGMAMVQTPETAKYDSMPRSAIKMGLADYVLPPEKMGEHLIEYAKRATYRVAPRDFSKDGEVPDAMQKIYILLRAQTGHDFSLYKPNTVWRRIERRMGVHQLDRVSNYVRYLQENPREVETLFKELLIGVPRFFRDPEAFQILKEKIFPGYRRDKPDNDSIRVWVPGCSSGEEAYSVAMIMSECMETLDQHFNVQIFATDIDADAIAMARVGIYPESIAADVDADRLRRFFSKEDGTYRVKKNVREMLVFAPHDIIKDPPFTKLDLVCCRNLLIYPDSILQKKLLPLFHYSLKPKGILFLGSSETIGDKSDLFHTLDRKARLYQRKEFFPALRRPATARSLPPLAAEPDGPSRRRAPSPERKIAVKCDRCLYMEKPVCVDVCPTKALEVVDLAEIETLLCEKRRKTAEAVAEYGGEGLRLLDVRRAHSTVARPLQKLVIGQRPRPAYHRPGQLASPLHYVQHLLAVHGHIDRLPDPQIVEGRSGNIQINDPQRQSRETSDVHLVAHIFSQELRVRGCDVGDKGAHRAHLPRPEGGKPGGLIGDQVLSNAIQIGPAGNEVALILHELKAGATIVLLEFEWPCPQDIVFHGLMVLEVLRRHHHGGHHGDTPDKGRGRVFEVDFHSVRVRRLHPIHCGHDLFAGDGHPLRRLHPSGEV